MKFNDTNSYFGFQRVNLAEKARRVYGLFSAVAPKYDLMNDLMSLGIHRVWKSSLVSIVNPPQGARILDLAAGSGDLALALGKKYPDYAELVVSDINPNMLQLARTKLTNAGLVRNVRFVQADAQKLNMADDYFDRIVMSFGLRNVPNKTKALHCMYSKLRSGGRVFILEFAKVTNAQLARLYDLYSFNVIPRLGKWVAKDKEGYQYLVESIRVHPEQAELLAQLQQCGFVGCAYHNMSFGIVAIHYGVKP